MQDRRRQLSLCPDETGQRSILQVLPPDTILTAMKCDHLRFSNHPVLVEGRGKKARLRNNVGEYLRASFSQNRLKIEMPAN